MSLKQEISLKKNFLAKLHAKKFASEMTHEAAHLSSGFLSPDSSPIKPNPNEPNKPKGR